MEFYTNKRNALKRIERLALGGVSYHDIKMDVKWNYGIGERLLKETLNDLSEMNKIVFLEETKEIKVVKTKNNITPEDESVLKEVFQKMPVYESEEDEKEDFEERWKRIKEMNTPQKKEVEEDNKEE